MTSIETKFGTIYIEDWVFDCHDDVIYREEDDKVRIYDTNINYLDYLSTELVEANASICCLTPQELLDRHADKLENAETIEDLLDMLDIEYEFVGTKDETIAYLHDVLNWDLPSDDYSPLDNEWINKIGDYYIVVCEN